MRTSDRLTSWGMGAAAGVVRALPRGMSLGVGGLLGGAALALGMRRRVTDDNLAKAFPELSPGERSDLARRVYRHFGRMAVDSTRLSSAGPEAVIPLVKGGECVELLRERLPRGKGAIVLTGHIGNWELAGSYLAAVGFPLAAVVKPPSNPFIAEQTEQVRRRLGIETIPMPRAPRGVLEALRQNKVVALVADQGAIRSDTWVPFFGQPTKTPSGPGLFGLRSGAPVLFGAMVAEGDGYRMDGEVIEEEVTGEPGQAIERIARLYRVRLEALVRRFPEQYLWTHRLWKQQPPPPPTTGAP